MRSAVCELPRRGRIPGENDLITRPKLHHVYSTLGHHFYVTTDGSPRPDPSGKRDKLRVPCPRCQKGKTLESYSADGEVTSVAECTVCDWWAYFEVV